MVRAETLSGTTGDVYKKAGGSEIESVRPDVIDDRRHGEMIDAQTLSNALANLGGADVDQWCGDDVVLKSLAIACRERVPLQLDTRAGEDQKVHFV